MDFNYQKQLEEGLEFQDFVTDKILDNGLVLNCYGSKKYQYEKGESKTGIEVKLDKRSCHTHNLYIEYAEKKKTSKTFIPSGIARTDNTWLYCIGDYETLYLIPKKTLKELKINEMLKHVETPTSKGYLLPCELAAKHAALIIKNEKGIS